MEKLTTETQKWLEIAVSRQPSAIGFLLMADG
jgi:hypothetical protein